MRNFFDTALVMSVTLLLLLISCATMAGEKVSGNINPSQMALVFPDVLKAPIEISGTGFKAREIVVVDLIVPPDVRIPGCKAGEPVGVAFAKADDKGYFKAQVDGSSKLNFLLRVKWTLSGLDKGSANPIPPGKYKMRLTGMESGKTKNVSWEILPSPTKGK